METYREFWNALLYGHQGGYASLERYWITTIVFSLACLVIGIASARLRFLAPIATGVIFLAYVVALLPFIVWTASCSSCGAAVGYESTRSIELYYVHLTWGGLFTMGVAAIWLGVLLSQGAKSHHRLARRTSTSATRLANKDILMQQPKFFIPTGAWNVRAGISPQQVLDAARKADASGIDGIFAGDHVTFYGSGNDGLICLTAVAAVTERVELMTSVYLLALRHPTPVALQCAMLDQLCLGRFILGVGIGGEDANEWWACGVDPKTRGRRTDESLAIMRSLWRNEETTFDGKYFKLDKVRMQPKPFRETGVTVHVGGRSDAALKRTARFGDAWMSIWISARRMKEAGETIAELAAAEDRDPATITKGIQLWHSVALDGDRAAAKARLARRMEGFYKIPYDRFERYSPVGTPEEIAEYIAPYLEAGCTHLNLLAVQNNPDETVEAGLAVKNAVNKMIGV